MLFTVVYKSELFYFNNYLNKLFQNKKANFKNTGFFCLSGFYKQFYQSVKTIYLTNYFLFYNKIKCTLKMITWFSK
jgi:hypothetical protein